MSSHLVVHYHRRLHDYSFFRLAVLPSATASPFLFQQARPHALTSFGAVFRLDLALLSVPHDATLHLLPTRGPSHTFDLPARPLHLATLNLSIPCVHHLFIADADPAVHLVPHTIRYLHLPRFLPLLLPFSAHPPLLHVRAFATSSSPESNPPLHLSVPPATPPYRPPHRPVVFLLDLAVLPTSARLHLQLLPAAELAHPPSAAPLSPTATTLALPPAHPAFTLTTDSHPVTAPYLPTKDSDHVAFILASQSEHAVALSPHTLTKIPIPSTVGSTIASRTHQEPPSEQNYLTIYVHIASHLPTPSLVLTPLFPRARPPPVVPLAKRHGNAHIFTADLSGLSATALADGLVISVDEGPTLQWKPSLGLHVVLASWVPRLLSMTRTDIRLYYHRLDALSDWSRWRLHLHSDATDLVPAMNFSLRPFRPMCPGRILFDLSDAIFPDGVVIVAELVRYPAAMEPSIPNSETKAIAPNVQPDCRDVLRNWPSGQLFTDLHLVQGDSTVHTSPPDRVELTRARFFRLRYRRFAKDDYDNWDLWTWDSAVMLAQQVPISPKHVYHDWAEFVIDRAAYGAGSTLSILPRRGGDDWLEKDEPVREWNMDLIQQYDTALREGIVEKDTEDDMPLFYISQSLKIVFISLAEVVSSVVASVVSENIVSVRTGVPSSWLTPTTKETVIFKMFNRSVEKCSSSDITSGRTIAFNKTEHVTPLVTEYHFSERIVHFDEDFLVECVSVSVPGFDTVVLEFQRYEDWDKYLYKGSLGWEYRKGQCSFRCFAPTADQLYVILYDEPTGDTGRTAVPMRRIPEGCWKAIVHGDLKGKFYKLLAEGENKQLFPGVEVIDPYSRCNTGHTGRGLIFGVENTKIHPRPNIKPSETIVYELHIRDISIDEESGVSRRGKFLGLTERGTRMTEPKDTSKKVAMTPWEQETFPGLHPDFQHLDRLSTGLDHIAQMGVTAVQILPIQDFDNDETDEKSYRWGYMPVHFNSPDGWYATNVLTASRITEFKLLVDAIHKAGMKVVMDVVYNHTAEDSNEFNLEARFSFNGICPRYYYRTCGNTPVAFNGDTTCGRRKPDEPRCGECYSNGSGCGNEFRSESPMGRKFIIDSMKYWATEYQVDGFRFDLLGLIDVDTIAQGADELHKVDPNIVVYGEPWCGGLTPIRTTEKGMQRSKGFGVFNNTFRDAIRGSPFDSEETFIMDGGRLTEVKGGIVGSIDHFCDSPLESINYVECHDNYTLWDHMRFYIRSRTGDIKYTEGDMRRMHKLAALILFTSQGVPFIQAGQEMCKTKFDVENSYESPDSINMVRWRTKLSEWSLVQYYRGLILLRRSHPEIFSRETAAEIREAVTFYEDLGLPVPERCIALRILGNPGKLLMRLKQENSDIELSQLEEASQQWSEIVILLNATPNSTVFRLPDGDKDVIWVQVVDATNAGVRNLRGPAVGTVEVGGRAGAVLRRASEKDAVEAQLTLRLDRVSDSYNCAQADNALTRYAVGLEREPTSEDVKFQEQLKAYREMVNSNYQTPTDSDQHANGMFSAYSTSLTETKPGTKR